MEILAWATFAVALVGMIFGGVNAYVGYARHRRETTQSMQEEAARWSLERVVGYPAVDAAAATAGWAYFKLARLTEGAPRVRLIELRSVTPGGTPLAFPIAAEPSADEKPWMGETRVGPDLSRQAQRLAMNEEMSADHHFAGGAAPHLVKGVRSSKYVFAKLPTRSLWSRSTRLQIRVIAEEISSTRRKINTVVRSEEIELTRQALATNR